MTAYMDHKDLANELISEERATQIRDGVHRVLDAIAEAQDRAGRESGSVRLLAATKTRDVGEIMAAIDAGVRMIGENRPQEVMAKAEGLRRLCAERGLVLGAADAVMSADAVSSDNAVTLADAVSSTETKASEPLRNNVNDNVSDGQIGGQTSSPIVSTPSPALQSAPSEFRETVAFHLIGQLQANKIGKVLPVVNTIESVDGIELAERIARRAVARNITVGVLLEVNESGEASKSGCEPEQAIDIANSIAAMDGLELQGLMTIGAHVDDEAVIRSGFAHLRRTRDAILASQVPGTEHCTELSMGMTQDMTFAIEEGSTIVRVGTAIFGPRAFI